MAKTKKAGDTDGTPIADVAHPGTTAPSDTSKPIINQRPIIKDPMVVEDDKAEDTAPPPAKKTAEVTVTPPGEPAADDPAPPEPEIPDKPEEKPEEPAEDTKPDKKSPEIDPNAEAQEAAKEAKLQQLIDSKKYSLPINSVEQRRSKRVVTLGIVLAVLLALAWANVALDAGLIHLDGVKPLTHFFSN